MISTHIAQLVLEMALSRGGDFAELFLEDRRDQSIVLKSNRIENVNSGRIFGAGIRIFVGHNAIYTYTNDMSMEGLLRCAKQTANAIQEAKKIGFSISPFIQTVAPIVHPITLRPCQTETEKKIAILKEANSSARACGSAITQVLCSYLDSEQDVTIINSDGLFVSDTRVYSRMACQAVASKGNENQIAHEAPGAMRGFELFTEHVNAKAIGETVGKSALLMIDAEPCPAGNMPVVIGNGFGGVLFHEACGHSLEATSVAPGASEFTGKLGEVIANERVTAYDDGTLPNEWGSENVDDEGTPTTNLTLIENGVLKNYMIDRLNSKRMNMPITGSARRQSYAYAPTSRMRNTYIANGTDSEKEMFATMGDGLYAAKLGGGSVNPATGEFNFSVMEGYLVKDGKIAQPVRGASLIGKGAEVLMRIDRVSDNMKMAQGMCGSISGSIPTNVGQPTIRVSTITVGGRV